MCHKILIPLIILGCGDPLVGGDHRGLPLLHLQGPIETPDGAAFLSVAACDAEWFECADQACGFEDDECSVCDPGFELCLEDVTRDAPEVRSDSFRLGLFWSSARSDGARPEVQQFALVATSFPARYGLTLYTPPPADTLQPASGSGTYALGVLLVYLDSNGDDRWTRGRDQIVGGAEHRAIVYTPGGIDDAGLGRLGPGYHRMAIEPICEARGEGFAHRAWPDASPFVLQLSVRPDLLANLVLDPDCDGIFDEFDACLDPAFVDQICAEGDHVLCALCRAALE